LLVAFSTVGTTISTVGTTISYPRKKARYSQLLAASGRAGTLDASLTPRENEVALMAEGRSNVAIAAVLEVSE
jgi:DNA-binding NarL/FixJ family response regulator